MMEQTNIGKLLIAVLCCAVVAGMNVPIDSTPETGASTQNRIISGQERRGIRATSTNRNQFVCADGSGSIDRTLLCNGRIDCVDSSDENSQLCVGISCMNTFPCLNGQCISLDSRCNDLDDCGDNSDEDLSICQQPRSSQIIICANGQVLKGVNILCNDVYNCMDKSDEIYLACTVNTPRPACQQYTCPSGKCIYFTDACDGYNDCGDNSDEQSCSSTTILQTTSTHICWDHTCPSGKCILPSQVCDGFYDCEDYSDESDCSTTYTYNYTTVAIAVTVPVGLVILVGVSCCCRRRRMRTTTRTTTTTTAAVAIITTTAVASDLPPPYSEIVLPSAPSQGHFNPAFAGYA